MIALLNILLLSFPLSAQIEPDAFGYYNDALRFSQNFFSGSARFQAIGGAQTALGADVGSAISNPAGFGFFRKSEFSFSPAALFSNNETTSSLNNQSNLDANYVPNIANLGLVLSFAKDEYEGGKWRGGAFGISLSRVNNFQNKFSFEGENRGSSLSDFYVEQANGINFNDLENLDLTQYEVQRAAYFAYLISPFADAPTEYYTYARDDRERLIAPMQQSEIITTKGATNQWSFSLGGNYDDRLYFGASLGITTINYTREKNFKETANYVLGAPKSYIDMTLDDELKVKGTGFNLSAGLIYRVNDYIRLGASAVSPTFYSMREEFSSRFQSTFDPVFNVNGNGETKFKEETLPGEFTYNLTTPFRLNLGTAIFIGKYGFISADAEMVDYRTMRLNNNEGFSFSADNRSIKNAFRTVWNLRLGGELRADIFRIRGGYAMYADPYNNIDDVNRQVQIITGGVGIRLPDYYVDIALVRQAFDSAYLPYVLASNSPYAGSEPITRTRNRITNIVVSAGIFF